MPKKFLLYTLSLFLIIELTFKTPTLTKTVFADTPPPIIRPSQPTKAPSVGTVINGTFSLIGDTVKDSTASVFSSIGDFFSSLFGSKTVITTPVPVIVDKKIVPTPSSPSVPATSSFIIQGTPEVINHYITTTTSGGITQAQLNAQLFGLKTTLEQEIKNLPSQQPVSFGGNFNGPSNSTINNLQNQITNITQAGNGGGGSGTVTSVGLTVPTGFTVSGSPVTTSGTLAISLAAGYNIPLTASTTAWNNFSSNPSSVITAGTGLTWSGNTLNASGGSFNPLVLNNLSSIALGFGNASTTLGAGASAVGYTNTATADNASAFGFQNTASNYRSSAFGILNTASGNYSSASGVYNTTTGVFSSAFGLCNTATSCKSSAFGYGSNASSCYTSAFGYSNTSSGAYSSAFGACNTASAYYSSAFGSQNTACNNYSSAVGLRNTTSGGFSSAFGACNIASNSYSSASGYGNVASGQSSSAFGACNTASADYSSAFGSQNTACNSYSSAVGLRNTASGYLSVALGACNTIGSCSTYSSSYSNYNYSGTESGSYQIAIPGNEASTINSSYSAIYANDPNTSCNFHFSTGSAYYSSGSTYVTYSGYYIPPGDPIDLSFCTCSCNCTGSAGFPGASAVGVNNTVCACNASAFGSFLNNSTGNSVEIGADNSNKLQISSSGVNFQTSGSGGFCVNSSPLLYASSINSLSCVVVGFDNCEAASNGSAVGYCNIACGLNSSAFGYNNIVSGCRSSASGYHNIASATYSSAFGYCNRAYCNLSSAFGYNNTTFNSSSSAFGVNNTACGNGSSAFGYQNTACNYYSSAFGAFNTASAYSSVSGYNNFACGTRSSAFGLHNTASCCLSSAFGSCLTNSTACSTMIGYNTSFLRVNSDNSVTASNGASLTAGGTWTNASDRNLKENFTDLDSATILSDINSLPITEWNYKTEGSSVKHIGPVAQDFYSIFNVGNASTSISTIDPAGIALIGIQELSKEVTQLQQAIGTSTLNDKVFTNNSLTSSISTSTDQSLLASTFNDFVNGIRNWATGEISAVTGYFKNIFASKVTTTNLSATNATTTNQTSTNISTQTLCVGNICVSQDQLKALLDYAHVSTSTQLASPTISSGANSGQSSDTSTSTSDTSTSTPSLDTSTSTPSTGSNSSPQESSEQAPDISTPTTTPDVIISIPEASSTPVVTSPITPDSSDASTTSQ